MQRFKIKPTVLRTVLAAIMATFVGVSVITTASGCVLCRDCGPNRAWRHR
jgi:hypothetical protein